MYKKLHSRKTIKRIWIILAALMLPPFLLWGTGSLMRNKKESNASYAGTVLGKKIPFTEYRDAIAATRHQALIQFGEEFSKIEKYLNLESQAWERIILLTEAKKRRIKATDREVIELIRKYPFFRNKQGFDNKIYNQMLKYVFRAQPRDFEEETRDNIILAKLFEEVTKNITVTDEEVSSEYEKANKEVSLYYIAAIPSEFRKDIKPSDEEIKNYFKNNQLEFKQPLSFNLEYVSSESQDQIESLLPHTKNKDYTRQLMQNMGLEIKETGLFAETGPIPAIGWSPQVLTLLAKARLDEYLPVVQIDTKFYLFLLKDKKKPFIPEFDAIKETVKEKFIESKTKEIARAKLEECSKKINEGDFDTLIKPAQKSQKESSKDKIANDKIPDKSQECDKIARACGLKSGSTDLFKYGSYIKDIGSSNEFWTAAQDLKKTTYSGVISIPSGFYIITLKAVNSPEQDKFQQEKEEFSQKVLRQKKEKFFIDFLAELKKQSNME